MGVLPRDAPTSVNLGLRVAYGMPVFGRQGLGIHGRRQECADYGIAPDIAKYSR